jgi:hypothetical protein
MGTPVVPGTGWTASAWQAHERRERVREMMARGEIDLDNLRPTESYRDAQLLEDVVTASHCPDHDSLPEHARGAPEHGRFVTGFARARTTDSL